MIAVVAQPRMASPRSRTLRVSRPGRDAVDQSAPRPAVPRPRRPHVAAGSPRRGAEACHAGGAFSDEQPERRRKWSLNGQPTPTAADLCRLVTFGQYWGHAARPRPGGMAGAGHHRRRLPDRGAAGSPRRTGVRFDGVDDVVADPAIRRPPPETGRPLAELLQVLDRAAERGAQPVHARLPRLHPRQWAGQRGLGRADRRRAEPLHRPRVPGPGAGRAGGRPPAVARGPLRPARDGRWSVHLRRFAGDVLRARWPPAATACRRTSCAARSTSPTRRTSR